MAGTQLELEQLIIKLKNRINNCMNFKIDTCFCSECPLYDNVGEEDLCKKINEIKINEKS